MGQSASSELLSNAFKERGRLYLEVFRELSDRYGQDEALDVLGTVSRTMGLDVGKSLEHHAPDGLKGLLEDFFLAPDDGATFATEVRRLDADVLEIKQGACPIKDSWIEAGCSEDEVATLLRCACAYDTAVIEAAGFDCKLEPWQPGRTGCCHAVITPKP